jgi:hypothetical protein
MQFQCPLCETAGTIPVDKIEKDVTKWECANCGAMLFVNSDSGAVDAHKSPFKDFSFTRRSGGDPSVLERSTASVSPAEGSRDWVAIGVFVGVLALLAGAGAYFFINLGLI